MRSEEQKIENMKTLVRQGITPMAPGDTFCAEYAESLCEGDLRPILLQGFSEENEGE